LLNDALKSMGMLAPFNANDADFSGLSSSSDLFIDQVLHKTFIAVDEFGTEAAAVTAIVMRTTSAGRPQPTPILFKADHPFVFFLRDSADGTVLFAGRVGNPVPPEGSAAPYIKFAGTVWEEKFGTGVITVDQLDTNNNNNNNSTTGVLRGNISSSNAVTWKPAGLWPLLLLLSCYLRP